MGAAFPPLSGGTKVRRLLATLRLWSETRSLQLPFDDCCRLLFPYHAVQHATEETDPSLQSIYNLE